MDLDGPGSWSDGDDGSPPFPVPPPGLLKTLGDAGEGRLIGVGTSTSRVPSRPVSAAKSHVSISSDSEDEEQKPGTRTKDSRYAQLGALKAKPGHASPSRPIGSTSAPAKLEEYPMYPRGKPEKLDRTPVGAMDQGQKKFVFQMPGKEKKDSDKKTRSGAAILIQDSDDEDSVSAGTSGKASAGPVAGKTAAKPASTTSSPGKKLPTKPSTKLTNDFVPLSTLSSDSDSDGPVILPKKLLADVQPNSGIPPRPVLAPPQPSTVVFPLPGSYIPPAPSSPERVLVVPTSLNGLPSPLAPPERPASAPPAKTSKERRKERRKLAKLQAKASKSATEESGPETTAAEDAESGSLDEAASEEPEPKMSRKEPRDAARVEKGVDKASVNAKKAAEVSKPESSLAQPQPVEAKPHFSFQIPGKIKAKSADLSKPLFETPGKEQKKEEEREDSGSDMEIDSDTGANETGFDSVSLDDSFAADDGYTDLDSMRARKKARHSGVEEEFISFSGLISDEEPEPQKKERYKPPQTYRMNDGDDKKRMFGDAQVAESPMLSVPPPPWIPDGRTYLTPTANHPAAMLNKEIKDFVEYIQPRAAEHAMRQIVVERVSSAVKSVWPNASVEIFGSFDTRMYLPSSDIDLVVFEPSARPPQCLEPLARAMKDLGLVHSLEVISTARVPIIKSIDSLTLFKLDISFNMTSGLDAAVIVKKMLGSRVGGALRGLMLVLKQFLLQRNMNEVFSGGVGSYGLMVMIANFLMLHPLIQSGIIEPMDSLGTLLMDFLELFGKNLNQQYVGIGLDVDEGGYFFPKRTGGRGGLSVIDPQDSSNDVTRGSFAYPSVRREFSNAHDLLRLTIQSHYAATKRYERLQLDRDETELSRRGGRHTRYDSDGGRGGRSRSRSVSPKRNSRRRARRRSPTPPPAPPSTLLGLIVRVRKSVQEHRTFISQRWTEIEAGKIDPREGKGVWGAVDAEWLAEIVEGEGREKKEGLPTGKKRKVDEEVHYVEADSEEEPLTSKARKAKAATPKPVPKDPLADLIGDGYDILSASYEMVGKVPVLFDDRRASGVGTSAARELAEYGPRPVLRGLLEPGEDEDEEEEKMVVVRRRGGEGWD